MTEPTVHCDVAVLVAVQRTLLPATGVVLVSRRPDGLDIGSVVRDNLVSATLRPASPPVKA